MAHLAWDRGGTADFASVDGDRVHLLSTHSGAPGSRIEGALAAGMRVRVKVHGCKRQAASELFAIEGRLIDASRALREELTGLARSAATPFT